MHTATIRSAQPLGILNERTTSPWRVRLRSILSSRWDRKNQAPKHDSLHRVGDRLLADVKLYRQGRHIIQDPQNRTHQQPGSPVPVALLAMWMPRN